MRIYFLRDESGNIIGAQAIVDYTAIYEDESESAVTKKCEEVYELTTNADREGLWVNGNQCIGHCNFDLCCSVRTAKERLIKYALTLRPWNAYEVNENVEVSRKPLMEG